MWKDRQKLAFPTLLLKQVRLTSRKARDLQMEEIGCKCQTVFLSPLRGRTSLVAPTVKPLPTMQETRVQSLGQEDLLEKERGTHPSILVWKIPWKEEHGTATVHGVAKSRTQVSNFTLKGRRKQTTSVRLFSLKILCCHDDTSST